MSWMYEVDIGDVGELPEFDVRKPAPEVRSVHWRGLAADEEAAKAEGWNAWRQKYGEHSEPVEALVNVARLGM
jgi:hypothetical protein